MTESFKEGPSNKSFFKIHGMHCPNCDVLVEQKLRTVEGIREVNADYTTGKTEITHSGELDVETLRNAIAEDGYDISAWEDEAAVNPRFDLIQTAAIVILLIGSYVFLRQQGLLPDNLTIPDTIGYSVAFLVGLVASVSTCMAVTGGLLVAVAARYNAATIHLTAAQRFRPHLYFNLGRIASYTILGGAIGAVGSVLSFSPQTNGILILLASSLMIALGLNMLGILPSVRILPLGLSKSVSNKIRSFSEKHVTGGAFTLGALTFFLPCGFTQALQLYVLSKGSFPTGALIMLAFSLGTLPALISLSALSSFVTGAFQRHFLKVAGAVVVILGLFNIENGLTLSAVGSESAALAPTGPATATHQPVPIVNGKQIVEMEVVRYKYKPHKFTVVAGLPVEWRIDAKKAAPCGRILIAPKIGVRQFLSSSETTVIDFTPSEGGKIRFNCGMGMMSRGASFTVIASPAGGPVAEATQPSPGPGALTDAERAEVNGMIRDYLLQNPEIIQEAAAVLEERQQAAEEENNRLAVTKNAEALLNSPHQAVVGNPQGDVTLVEFFDYNCGYCKGALKDTVELLSADPKLRIVLKEFPVLGEESSEAAAVAVAVRMQDTSGGKYLEFHKRLLASETPADRARALEIAREIGLDMTRIENDLASPEVKATIEESYRLAQAIGVNGTPSYVIGGEVMAGAVGLEALREKIDASRN